MLSDGRAQPRRRDVLRCLNAPYGAPCFLTEVVPVEVATRLVRLNAPYGAPCFLTQTSRIVASRWSSLNAPYGAPCFLTVEQKHRRHVGPQVLMHLMALRAF